MVRASRDCRVRRGPNLWEPLRWGPPVSSRYLWPGRLISATRRGGGVRQLVPRNGSPLGDRKRLAAMIAPQVHVMVRDQRDGKSVLVAIEAGEPLENRLELPRSLGSKVHAASLSERDRESVLYTDKVYARPPQRVQHRFTSDGIGRAATGSAGV